ncbi:MAG: anti-sigma factor family protein [Planctomycetota bacterium]|jgi:anti-sigma factor RsiW
MDRELIDQRMADYLGGEMTAEEQEAFLATLEEHPDLAQDLKELEHTLIKLKTLKVPSSSGSHIRSLPREEPGIVKPSKPFPFLRFAAALVAAFIAGYLFHGGLIGKTAQEMKTNEHQQTAVMMEDPDALPDSGWQVTFAQAYMDERSDSRLARSWVALSRALKER